MNKKISLPHDQSKFFSSQKYWDAVKTFLDGEIKNDGKDITSEFFLQEEKFIPFGQKKYIPARVYVYAKEKGIMAGKEELSFFINNFFPKVNIIWSIQNGESIEKNQKIFWATGNSYDLMKLERIFLNILSRMSGIATTTKELVEMLTSHNTVISATRKTLWSYLDKKAVHIGGGLTHRIGLFDAILIKENHQIITHYSLPIKKYLEKDNIKKTQFIEVEVETTKEFEKIFNIFWNSKNIHIPKVIMFDNFSPEKIAKILKYFPPPKKRYLKNIFLEASGGINKTNIIEYEKSGVDVISMGALTNFVKPIDFSMRVESQI